MQEQLYCQEMLRGVITRANIHAMHKVKGIDVLDGLLDMAAQGYYERDDPEVGLTDAERAALASAGMTIFEIEDVEGEEPFTCDMHSNVWVTENREGWRAKEAMGIAVWSCSNYGTLQMDDGTGDFLNAPPFGSAWVLDSPEESRIALVCYTAEADWEIMAGVLERARAAADKADAIEDAVGLLRSEGYGITSPEGVKLTAK